MFPNELRRFRKHTIVTITDKQSSKLAGLMKGLFKQSPLETFSSVNKTSLLTSAQTLDVTVTRGVGSSQFWIKKITTLSIVDPVK